MGKAVPDLPLCLGVHRAPLASGVGASSCQNLFYDGFLLMWCNFKFDAFCFWAISDIMIELMVYVIATFRAQVRGSHNLTSTGSHLS